MAPAETWRFDAALQVDGAGRAVAGGHHDAAAAGAMTRLDGRREGGRVVGRAVPPAAEVGQREVARRKGRRPDPRQDLRQAEPRIGRHRLRGRAQPAQGAQSPQTTPSAAALTSAGRAAPPACPRTPGSRRPCSTRTRSGCCPRRSGWTRAGDSTACWLPHDQVARVLGRAHEVDDALGRVQVEVEVDLGAPRVRVRRQRVPDAAGLDVGHAHHQLAAARRPSRGCGAAARAALA